MMPAESPVAHGVKQIRVRPGPIRGLAAQRFAVRPHHMQVGAQYPSQCRSQTQLRTGLSKPQPNGET
jgi:hypothetical protein